MMPSLDSPPERARVNGDSWPFYATLAGCLAVAHVLAIRFVVPEVLTGHLVDPDSYTRLLRVDVLAGSGHWFNTIVDDLNAPYGLDLHWTRPLDVLLLLGSWPFSLVVESGSALHWAGVFVSPVLHVLTCLGLAWAVAPLLGNRHRPLIVLVFVMQPLVLNYAYAGRADHHMLLLLCWVVSLGFYLRAVSDPSTGRSSFISGAVAGLGLWVSVEFILPLLTLCLSLAVLWIMRRPGATRACLTFAAGLASVAVIGLLAEHAPGDLLMRQYDRLSAPHVLLTFLALGFWLGVRRLETSGAAPQSIRARTLLVVLAGIALLVPTVLLFPGLVSNPMGDLDPRFETLLIQQIEELRPIFPTRLSEVGMAVARLGHVAFAAPFLIWTALPGRDWISRAAWLPFVVGLVVFVPLGLLQFRYGIWAGVPVAVGAAGFLIAMTQTLSGAGTGRMVGRASLAAGVLLAPLFLGSLMLQVWGEDVPGPPRAGAEDGACSVKWLASDLVGGQLGQRPRVILAHPNIGPELAYRTPHRVVAAPYHRNVDGVLDAYDMMATTDDEQARMLMDDRGVDLVALCPDRDGWFLQGVDEEEESLYWRLTRAQAPPWLEPIDFPDGAASGFLVFRVAGR